LTQHASRLLDIVEGLDSALENDTPSDQLAEHLNLAIVQAAYNLGRLLIAFEEDLVASMGNRPPTNTVRSSHGSGLTRTRSTGRTVAAALFELTKASARALTTSNAAIALAMSQPRGQRQGGTTCTGASGA
jgi:hypothetical protein